MGGAWSGHPPPGPDPRCPPLDLAPVVVKAVIDTLRHIQGFPGGAPDPQMLNEIVEAVEASPDPADWLCCPFCEETVCDSGCPFVAFSEIRTGPRQ